MSAKLRFKKRNSQHYTKRDRIVIRVEPNAYYLVDEISINTGLSKTKVVSKMIEFAYDNVEYI